MPLPEPIVRRTIILASKSRAPSDLQGFGVKVGDRIGDNSRTHDQREDFCVRYLVLGLSVEPTCPYPSRIVMLQQDQAATWPDCLVWWGEVDDPIGLEVTQATTAEWQRALTQDERDVLNDPSAADEVEFIGPEDGWAGDGPENETASLIVDAISKKAAGLNLTIGKYRGTPRCDLLVYADDASVIATGISSNEHNRPMDTLIHILEKKQLSVLGRFPRMFRRVHILIGEWLIFSLLSDPQAIRLPRYQGAL